MTCVTVIWVQYSRLWRLWIADCTPLCVLNCNEWLWLMPTATRCIFFFNFSAHCWGLKINLLLMVQKILLVCLSLIREQNSACFLSGWLIERETLKWKYRSSHRCIIRLPISYLFTWYIVYYVLKPCSAPALAVILVARHGSVERENNHKQLFTRSLVIHLHCVTALRTPSLENTFLSIINAIDETLLCNYYGKHNAPWHDGEAVKVKTTSQVAPGFDSCMAMAMHGRESVKRIGLVDSSKSVAHLPE